MPCSPALHFVDHAEHIAAALTAKLGARKAADGCVGTGRVAVHRQKSRHLFVCAIGLKDGLLPNPVGTFFWRWHAA